LSVIRADYLAACDGTHSDVREALGVKTNGLGALDEHYIYVYFGANWSELIRGYDTLFLTLCGRAFDNRLAHPILGDAMAEEIVKSSITTPKSSISARARLSTSRIGRRSWTRWRTIGCTGL
jgi:FAD binding domain-containing protein